MQAIRIGTRNSPLALKQVEEVITLLEKAHPECNFDIIEMETAGDKDKTIPLEELEGTDFWTREIEKALLEKKIDLAVHSAKDMPDVLPNGLEIAVVLKSVDPYDVLVSKSGLTLEKLPEGAKIGTSSKRRKEGLKKFRPDFQIVDIRGNIEERLKLLEDNESQDTRYEIRDTNHELDAIVIAAAGLIRLGLEDRITERLPFHILEPHPLQGCLAIEIRTGDKKIKSLIDAFSYTHHHPR